MTRTTKKRLVIAGILVALPVLFLVEEHFRGRWMLAKLKRQLVARGEKLTIKECWPPAPESEAENGYAELLRAAAMLGGGSLTYTAPRSLRAVAPGKVQVILGLAEWRVSDNVREPTNNNWRTLEESLAAWSDRLAEARAAIRKPAFDPRTDYTRGFDGQLPYLGRIKSVAPQLAMDALIHLHHGRLDEAVEDIEAQLLLSHQMRNERFLISQLVRIAIASIAIGPTWQALQAPGLTDAQLARLQRAWETNEFVLTLSQSLEMERAMGTALFARLRDGSVDDVATELDSTRIWSALGSTAATGPVQSFDDLVERVGEGSSRILTKGLYVPVWQFSWSRQDEAFYLEGTQDLLEGCREASRQYSYAPISTLSKQLEQRWKDQSGYSRVSRRLSMLAVTSLASSPQRAASIEAQRTLVVTAIALKRYELRQGAAPPALTALVPEFLREIPRDIFDGQPLRYRPGEGGRYLLYSIGKDEHDDGGDPVPPDKTTRSLQLYYGRDWVWPMPATEEEIQAADEKEAQKK